MGKCVPLHCGYYVVTVCLSITSKEGNREVQPSRINLASSFLGIVSHWSLSCVPPSTTLSWLLKTTQVKSMHWKRNRQTGQILWDDVISDITIINQNGFLPGSFYLRVRQEFNVKKMFVPLQQLSERLTRKICPRIGWTDKSLANSLAPIPEQLIITSKSEANSSKHSSRFTTTLPPFLRNCSIKWGINLDPSQVKVTKRYPCLPKNNIY